MKIFAINEQLRNALINYLSHRPHSEVEEPIMMLRSLEQIPEPSNVDAPDKGKPSHVDEMR